MGVFFFLLVKCKLSICVLM
uniref:Uncharacterized protein n=1 Tax=Arundo donax TaxID=35708 RepID=A0A0A9GR03_ARUDO